MTSYLSYALDVLDKQGSLYTHVFPTQLFPVYDIDLVYKHILEVISQKFDKLPESDGSLSLAELETFYMVNKDEGLSGMLNKTIFIYPNVPNNFSMYAVYVYIVQTP